MRLPYPILLLACVAPDSKAPPDSAITQDSGDPVAVTLLITDVTIVDVDGARSGRSVGIADGQITWIGDATTDWPSAAHIDGAGRFLVPGLVDPHVHLTQSGATSWTGDALDNNLRANLYYGVTAVMDVGGSELLFPLRDRIQTGEVLGPTLLATGPFLTAEGSHPCEQFPWEDLCVFVTPDNAAAATTAQIAQGADAIKVALADAAFTPWPTPRLDVDALAAITAAATVPVLAHIDTEEDQLDALENGVTILAHPVFAAPLSPSGVQAATTATAIHSTVGAFAGVLDLLEGRLDPEDAALLIDPETRASWAFIQANPEVLEEGWAEASVEWAANARANLGAMLAADATVLPASDAGYYFIPHGAGLHRELAELAAMGLPPLTVLGLATATAREVLGLEGGRIEVGAPADLLLLTDDPTLSVAALGTIEQVIRAGTPYAREELRTIDLYAGPSPDVCLEDADCASDARCDATTHACTPACDPPYDRVGSCDADSWCMPSDGLDAAAGVCHPEVNCDLYAQDCTPTSYNLACVPYDLDTTGCWHSGPQQEGDACSWSDAAYACAPGLFCSWVDYRCYRLCDPTAADTCAPPTRCQQQIVEGEAWFGLCL